MRRKIKLKKAKFLRSRLEELPAIPERVSIALDEHANRCRVTPVVRLGQTINAGDPIGEGESLYVHASISGRVTELRDNLVTISREKSLLSRRHSFSRSIEKYKNADATRKLFSYAAKKVMTKPALRFAQDSSKSPERKRGIRAEEFSCINDTISLNDFSRFIASIGLVGMGGGMFPSSIKIAASQGVSTLVINCVECEPEVSIDKCLLLENDNFIKAGAQATAKAIGANRIILALNKSARNLHNTLSSLYPYDLVFMPAQYPSGSERLILKKLTHKIPPVGIFPFQLGYLVQNATSLGATGKAIIEGVPVIERPLTLNIPEENIQKNVIVPVGMRVGEILAMYGHHHNADCRLIIAGGLMMGRVVDVDFCIQKGTNAIFVISKKVLKEEGRCMLCGSCFDICPLNLHPILMVEKIKRKDTKTSELKAQLDECFLCGACSCVCPSAIQLVRYLKEGKEQL